VFQWRAWRRSILQSLLTEAADFRIGFGVLIYCSLARTRRDGLILSLDHRCDLYISSRLTLLQMSKETSHGNIA
jgi:hypothetical protein